jgi:AraC-like DNA-binding protein
MPVVITADDVPVSERRDYWQTVIDSSPIPLEGRFAGAADFRSQIISGRLGVLNVTESVMPAGVCSRTRAKIRQSDPDLYRIDVVRTGRVILHQHGAESVLGPGDLVCFDPSRPARLGHTDLRHVSVTLPRNLLPLQSAGGGRRTGPRVPGDRGIGGLASSIILLLPQYLEDWSVAEGVRLGSTLIDLLAIALDPGKTARAEPAPQHQYLLQRIYAYIEQQLSDRALSPGAIAAAHHISTRYLHKLFETQEATVGSWIRRRRLERCRRDLIDPALAGWSVSAIASRWGFGNPMHFSRAFRAEYGTAPSAYRSRTDRIQRMPDVP